MSGATRGQRRSLGRRRLKREATRDVERALELHEKGYSAETISSVVKMPVELVEEIIKYAEDLHESGEGEGG
jgi:hypothetical protein